MSYEVLQYKKLAQKYIHLGVCGSIAAYKSLELLRAFIKCNIHVSVTLTPSAEKFITALSFEALGASKVYRQMFQGEMPFDHLEPGQLADAMVIAPASATSIARLAHGLGDEMLACQALAFDGPILVAPAMNPKMWANPATSANMETLLERGFFLTEPKNGVVACKDEGQGRLARLEKIYYDSLALLTEQDLYGKKILITLGPTAEKWDAVRVWTNNSTGSMGTALAITAWLRGAEVYVVAGPNSQYLPEDMRMHVFPVVSADEMYKKCHELWSAMDYGIFAAAVADFKPEAGITEEEDTGFFQAKKFKKENHTNGFDIHFSPNQDILKSIGQIKKPGQKLMGFSAESGTQTEELASAVRQKLNSKNCDIIAGNFLTEAMGKKTNKVYVADKNGIEEAWGTMSKADLAWDLLSYLDSI